MKSEWKRYWKPRKDVVKSLDLKNIMLTKDRGDKKGVRELYSC